MHTLYNFTKKLYIKSVEAHIRLLTLDYTKHQATEAVYEDLFDVFHKVGEQSEAIGEPINEDTECKAIIQDLIDDETKLASIIEKQVKDGLDL
jgi:DNA-binding ferritin-like protein